MSLVWETESGPSRRRGWWKKHVTICRFISPFGQFLPVAKVALSSSGFTFMLSSHIDFPLHPLTSSFFSPPPTLIVTFSVFISNLSTASSLFQKVLFRTLSPIPLYDRHLATLFIFHAFSSYNSSPYSPNQFQCSEKVFWGFFWTSSFILFISAVKELACQSGFRTLLI